VGIRGSFVVNLRKAAMQAHDLEKSGAGRISVQGLERLLVAQSSRKKSKSGYSQKALCSVPSKKGGGKGLYFEGGN